MKYLIYLVTILIIIGLTGGVFDLFPFYRAVPQLLLILVGVVAVERKNLDYVYVALVSGVFMDMLTGVAFGSYTLSFYAAALIIHFLFKDILLASNTWKHLPWIVMVATLCQHLWIWLYNGSLARLLPSAPTFAFVEISILALASSAYTLLLFYPSYWLFERLNAFLTKLEQTRKY